MNQTLNQKPSYIRIILACFFWIALCLIIAAISGWVTSHNITPWYSSLQKAFFNPPAWLFGPVWTVLYIMIGIAGGLLWANRKKDPRVFYFYVLQLCLNFAWSFVFFGAHLIGWAFIEIIVLWLSILTTMVLAYRSNIAACWLLIPYFVWVSFASVLNFSLWYLNSF